MDAQVEPHGRAVRRLIALVAWGTARQTRAARAARHIRHHPRLGIVLLSQHTETSHSVDLVTSGRFGYHLKDRAFGVEDFLDAPHRVAAGGSALDPDVISRRLRLTARTVETHVGSILAKPGLADSDEDHRRVLAVLRYLDHPTRLEHEVEP
ncbi:hypothetical protein [Actinosynnema sp. NPDC020468]|uniref:hypothetical protein n=1 Tax=Actinosynnema sp. NPDC020468 TaxID=3154488 RepID=UPI0033DB3CCE